MGNTLDHDDPDGAVQRTRGILDELRVSQFNDVRQYLEEEGQVVSRLIVPKAIRVKGVNVKDYQACSSSKSRGPFCECVSFGQDVFGGACSCCQYSSLATSCVFHKSKKGSKFAECHGDEMEETDTKLPEITDAMLKHATTHLLERLRHRIDVALEEREEKDEDEDEDARLCKRVRY
ncbi:hypothetical protein F4802DRAFT_593738 [Xylaria palmicola]|nr:hypothetical protein F4802DRAFT_593738 [Xylaria palmicola]